MALKSKQPPHVAPESLRRVRELAWTGRQQQAIEAATAALATHGLGAAHRIDLLGLSAESALVEALMRVEPR